MVRHKLLLIAFGALACAPIAVSPVAAQFGAIFGGPPRPPADVPQSGPPSSDDRYFQSSRPPQQMWPREPQVVQPPPGGYQQAYPPPPGYPPQQAGRPPGGYQQQELPPPPGATAAPPGQRPPRGAPVETSVAPVTPTPPPVDPEVVIAPPAQKIPNTSAVFSGLDKITGRIISFEVEVDETVQFGALQMTPRVCYSRPPTESPQTTTFVEVDEVTLENKYRRVFTGWMFASSPGLHGIEHAIYDIWLTECKGGQEVIVEAKDPDATPVPSTGRDRGRRQTAQPSPQVSPAGLPQDGRLDVPPPRGVPVQPRQQPTRRFFPTNPGGGGFDPSGGTR